MEFLQNRFAKACASAMSMRRSVVGALLLSVCIHVALIVAVWRMLSFEPLATDEQVVRVDFVSGVKPAPAIAQAKAVLEPSSVERVPKTARAQRGATESPVMDHADRMQARSQAASEARKLVTTMAPASAPVIQPVQDPVVAMQLNLLDWLARYRVYPIAARRARLEGTVHLRAVLMPDGSLIDRRVEQSSGHPVLDRSALELLDRASPLPASFGDARAQQIELHLPVVYRMSM